MVSQDSFIFFAFTGITGRGFLQYAGGRNQKIGKGVFPGIFSKKEAVEELVVFDDLQILSLPYSRFIYFLNTVLFWTVCF